MSEDSKFHADRIRVDGYTVFEGLLTTAHVEAMYEAFVRLMQEHSQQESANRGANRFQMYLPFTAPFAETSVYENDRVLSVVEAVFGNANFANAPDSVTAACTYFASDTPLPGSDYQPVHSDTRLLFPETPLSLPSYGLVLNIPLVTVTEENGPLEIWPGGTHLWPGGSDMAALAAKMQSVRLKMKRGDVLLRDLRMWHRGTPNRSDHMRPNVALVYTRPWYRFEQKPPVIAQAAWDGLSERAKKLFRFAAVTP